MPPFSSRRLQLREGQLLPLPPAAKVLGLNGEVPSQEPEGPVPRLWAGGVSPAALRSPGSSGLYKAKCWPSCQGDPFLGRALTPPPRWGQGVCSPE